jgi:hypothetical protein
VARINGAGPVSAATDHEARSGFSTGKSETRKPTTEKSKRIFVLTMAPSARWAVRYRGSNVVLETFASNAGAQARIKQLVAQGCTNTDNRADNATAASDALGIARSWQAEGGA